VFDLKRVESLATHFEEQGDYETAELLLSNVLEIKSRDKDTNPCELIDLLHRLATICESHEKHAQALKYAQQAFKIVKDRLGSSGYDTTDALNWIKLLKTTAVA
jgi:hypothetical protein